MRRILLLLSVVLVLPACGGQESEVEPAAQEADASAFVACRHFRNVMGDVDILSPEELRVKVQEIHDKARVSEEPGVAESARGMLAAATADDGEAFMMSVGQMSDACREAGL
jgi:hypothetical protein